MRNAAIEISPDGSAIMTEGVLPGWTQGQVLEPGERQLRELELRGSSIHDNPSFESTTLSIAEKGETCELVLDGLTDIHPHLTWQQIAFIQGKCKELKNFKAVTKSYPSKSHVCTYARNFARHLYESNSKQESYTPVEKWEKGKSKASASTPEV